MPAECRSVLKACLAQFVLVDACGDPITGSASRLTTKGFISVAATAQIETGTEHIVKNACGDFCINERDDDLFKRYDLEMKFCAIDPQGLSLIGSARALADSGTYKGFAVGESTAEDSNAFSLELWTKIAGASCSVSGDPEWFYFAFPWIAPGVITDVTFEDGPLEMTVKSHTKGTGDNWLRGPSAVLPVGEPAQSGDHMIGFITDVQPPEDTCGLAAYPAA